MKTWKRRFTTRRRELSDDEFVARLSDCLANRVRLTFWLIAILSICGIAGASALFVYAITEVCLSIGGVFGIAPNGARVFLTIGFSLGCGFAISISGLLHYRDYAASDKRTAALLIKHYRTEST